MREPVNVEEATSVRVGETYLVNAVFTNPSSEPWSGARIPVIGTPHSDLEVIKFPYEHWHVDWRFVSAEILERVKKWITSEQLLFKTPVKSYKNHHLGIPVLVRRSGQPHRIPLVYLRNHDLFDDDVAWLADLERAHLDRRMSCNACPHRGISLVGAPEGDPGAVVCPGHGLQWDKQTGILRPRAMLNEDLRRCLFRSSKH